MWEKMFVNTQVKLTECFTRCDTQGEKVMCDYP